MLYHRLNAFRVMEKYSKNNNINYDGVIVYRPDLYFLVPLDLSKFILNDHTIYFRLDFMIISSFNGIKKIVTELLNNYYCNAKNINYIQSYKNCTPDWQLSLNISEVQHNIFFYNKENNLNSFDILNCLIHFRGNGMFLTRKLGDEFKIDRDIEEFYNILDKCNKKVKKK
jgi:hypothetical protein